MTFTEKVAAYFIARPQVWIDGRELATLGGAYAWRSRVSDCRTNLGMHIDNRQRREGKAVRSEYRYTPAEDIPASGAADLNTPWVLR